ncbi:hypothetical protein ARSEF1564_010002 [Beauveria bassiana]
MKKKKSKKIPDSTDSAVPAVNKTADSRPETSVFTAPIKTFQTNDGSRFNILLPLLKECPKLADKVSDQWGIEPKLDITPQVGHILVNYLFTKRYEHIRPEGSSDEERFLAELATDIRVYAFAQRMDFVSLQNLAICEIQRIGRLLPFVTIVDQVRIAYPQIPSDDLWFIGYLKSGIKSLAESEPALPKQGTLSVSDVLLQGFIESYTNGISSGKRSPKATPCTSQDGFTLVMSQVTESAPEANAEGSLMDHRLGAESEAEPPVHRDRHESDEGLRGSLLEEKLSEVKTCPLVDELKIEPEIEAEKPIADETAHNDNDIWGSCSRREPAKTSPGRHLTQPLPDFEPGKPVVESIFTFGETGWGGQPTCPLRSEHVFGDRLTGCTNCQNFVHRISKKFATAQI